MVDKNNSSQNGVVIVSALNKSNEFLAKLYHLREGNSKWGNTLNTLESLIRNAGGRIAIVGGFIRDLYLSKEEFSPRDIDLVVDNMTIIELEKQINQFCVGKTSLGGYKLIINDCYIDIWRVQDTFSFTIEKKLLPSFNNLSYTTFLNIESIVIELQENKLVTIHDNGFSNAINTGILDINYELNSFPPRNIVKSLTITKNLNMKISKALAEYIVKHNKEIQPIDLKETQERYYGEQSLKEFPVEISISKLQKALECKEYVPVNIT